MVSHLTLLLTQITWLVVTEVRRKSFGLVTERRHYNAIYAQCSSARPVLFSTVRCGIACFLCACARYALIRRSGIILTPRVPVYQISFLWRPPVAELAHGENRILNQSLTQSLTQLIWSAGNRSFRFGILRIIIQGLFKYFPVLSRTSSVFKYFKGPWHFFLQI